MKIYREGNCVVALSSGKKFEDFGLNYDRNYNYSFVSETTWNGKLVKSFPTKASVTVKSAVLEASLLSESQYKTPFTDEFAINGQVSYQMGGKVSLSLTKKSKEVAKM